MVLDAGSAAPVVFVPSTAWARPLAQTDSSLQSKSDGEV